MPYSYSGSVDYRLIRPKTEPQEPNNLEKPSVSLDFAKTLQQLWTRLLPETDPKKQPPAPPLAETISKRMAESQQLQAEQLCREEKNSLEKRWKKVSEQEQRLEKLHLKEQRLRAQKQSNRMVMQKQADLRRQQERVEQAKIEEKIIQAKITRERQIVALLNLIAHLKRELCQQGFDQNKAAQLDQLKLELAQAMGMNQLNWG